MERKGLALAFGLALETAVNLGSPAPAFAQEQTPIVERAPITIPGYEDLGRGLFIGLGISITVLTSAIGVGILRTRLEAQYPDEETKLDKKIY